MTIFDTIRYPINEYSTIDDIRAIPEPILVHYWHFGIHGTPTFSKIAYKQNVSSHPIDIYNFIWNGLPYNLAIPAIRLLQKTIHEYDE